MTMISAATSTSSVFLTSTASARPCWCRRRRRPPCSTGRPAGNVSIPTTLPSCTSAADSYCKDSYCDAAKKAALCTRSLTAAMTRERPTRDKPWIFRTYAGHSTAADSNALYRKNLAKGQTGLSVAFDLPTQTGYDSDHVLD